MILKQICNNLLRIRTITASNQVRTKIWNKQFVEPIVTKEELENVKENNPERYINLQYNKVKSLDGLKANNLFYDPFLYKLIGRTTRLGARERADKLIKETLFLIKKDRMAKCRQLKPEERANFVRNPIKIAAQAWENCKPTITVTQVERGGSKYFAPVPVLDEHKETIVFRWVREVVENRPRPRPEKFPVVFARELLLAYKEEGKLIKKKLDLYRLAEANKAYVGYVYLQRTKQYSK